MTGEVDGQDAVAAGQQRGEVVPVGVRAAEAVDGDDGLAGVLPAVVGVVHGAVEVHRAGCL